MNFTHMSDTSLPPGADYNYYQQTAQDDRISYASAPAGRSQMDDTISPTEIEESLVPVVYELLKKIEDTFKRAHDDFKALPTLENGPNADDFAVNHREPPLKTRLESVNILPIEELRRKYDSEVQQNAVLQRDLRTIRNMENFLKQRLSFVETLLYRQNDVIDKVRETMVRELEVFNSREQTRIKACQDLKKETRENLRQIRDLKEAKNLIMTELKNQKKKFSELEKKYSNTSEKNRELQTERDALRNEIDQLKKDLADQKARLSDTSKTLTAEQKALTDERHENKRLNTELQRHTVKIDQLEKQLEKERDDYNDQMERTERGLHKQKTDEIETLKRTHREELSQLKSDYVKELENFKTASGKALQKSQDEIESLRIERDQYADELNKMCQNREDWKKRITTEIQQKFIKKTLEANVEFGREQEKENARYARKIPRQIHNPAQGYLQDLNCPSANHSEMDSPFRDQNLPPPLRTNPIRRTNSFSNMPNAGNRKLQQVIAKVVQQPKDPRNTGRRN